MTIETGVVLDLAGQPLYWHLPPGRSMGGLPDSRNLWDVIWENRDIISGFAHSHPGSGKPGPSHTDVTTFAAIEAALGRRLDWWIVSAEDEALTLLRWAGVIPGNKLNYSEPFDASQAWAAINKTPPEWIKKLCEASQTVTTKVAGHVTQIVTHTEAGDAWRMDVDTKLKM